MPAIANIRQRALPAKSRIIRVKRVLDPYFLSSLAIHILILFLVRDYFTDPSLRDYRDLEVEIRPPQPPAEEKKVASAPVEEPKKPLRIYQPKPKGKIPRKVKLPPRPLDEKAELSMFRDEPKKKAGKGAGGAAEKKKPKPQKQSAKTTVSTSPRTTKKEKVEPFKTGDVFVKKIPPEKKKTLDLADLDRYIDPDTFDRSELFGDSMLKFGDKNFRYDWYGRVVKKRVVDGWFPPVAARMGLTGKAVVTFSILRDGAIDRLKLDESTGNGSLDRAAVNAVKSAGSFPELPGDYEYERLGVVFSFWYNLSRSDS